MCSQFSTTKLQKLSTSPQSPSITKSATDRIDAKLVEGMIAEERLCRNLFMVNNEFSSEMNWLGKIWDLWKIVRKLNMGGKINHDRVNKMSRACIVKAPFSHPLPIYMAHRTFPRTAYPADKPNAVSMRLSFFLEMSKFLSWKEK